MASAQDHYHSIVLPELKLSQVRVSVWYAAIGDHVYQGDRVVEVIGDGATFDVPAPVTGHVVEQRVFARDVLQAGQVLGTVEADPE